MNQIKKHSSDDRGAREQQMRARIKDAAFKLMAEKGIDGVSMREIAEKVHVTKPVLYYYFKDKEDLCSAIIEERTKQFDEFLEGTLAKGPGAAQLLGLVFERHLDFFQNDPRNSKFIARTIAYVLNNKSKGFRRGGDNLDRLREVFHRAAAKGEIAEKGLPAFEYLVRAVLLQIMLSAYVQMHSPSLSPSGKENFCDKAAVHRLAQIIVLGVNEYYKDNKK